MSLRNGVTTEIRTASLTIKRYTHAYTISDLISLNWYLGHRSIVTDALFWVDQVRHEVNQKGEWFVHLEVSDYRLSLPMP